MSETKFTPGPWKWSNAYKASNNENLTWSLLGENGYGILSCDGESNSPQELGESGKANAHLIAAAPDLYKALEELVNADGILGRVNARPKAKAALAKARGEA